MDTRLRRVIDLTTNLTEEKIIEAIRKTRFRKNYEKPHHPHHRSNKVIKKGRIQHKPYIQKHYYKNHGK